MRCDPWPWLDEYVTDAIYQAIDEGMTSEAAITARVLSDVYPSTVDGRPVKWPCVKGRCAAADALEYRARAKVRATLAALRDGVAHDHYLEICGDYAGIH